MYFMVCFLNNNIKNKTSVVLRTKAVLKVQLVFGAPFLFLTPVCFSGVIFSHVLAIGHLVVRYRTMTGSVMYT